MFTLFAHMFIVYIINSKVVSMKTRNRITPLRGIQSTAVVSVRRTSISGEKKINGLARQLSVMKNRTAKRVRT